MTADSVIKQASVKSPKWLAKVYEGICEIYRKRLCELWEVPFEESWWIADRFGEGLCIADSPWVLHMPELRYLVDNCISEAAYLEYWESEENEINNGSDHPRINFMSWFRFGARPKDLKE